MVAVNYDVVVIGLGPSGIMATLTLSQKGYRVVGIDRGKSFEKRDSEIPYDVANGFGGAGFFSDGKLSFFPAASNLWDNLDKGKLKEAYLSLQNEFNRIGYHIPKWQNHWTISKQRSRLTKRVKRYKTRYFDRKTCDDFIRDVYKRIQENVILESEVILIAKNDDGTFQVFLDKPTETPLTTKNIVLATGKVGNRILNLFENVSFETNTRFEGGIRVETDYQNFRPYELKQIDYKYIETFTDGAEFSTFCCCKDGQVLESDYLGNVSFNGSITPHSTGRSNIGLTVRVENEDSEIADEIKACISRHEEFVFDYNDRYDSSQEFFIGPIIDQIILERIGLIVKSKKTKYKTKIYGPEIEYSGKYPEFAWNSLRINDENIWVVGDLSAKYRGLIAAMVSGIYAANNIAQIIKKVD